MVELAIRCHPSVPVPDEELEVWIERQLADLRATAPNGIIRLLRLTQSLPSTEIAGGWLIELALDPDEAPLTGERLGEVLRDMRLLGLDPHVLTSLGTTEAREAEVNGAVA
ncbi:MAG: hypothetical protein M3340_00745 [Actinomycetota bacterium]|nr:hypothetical protein [Actinomycetota bacterium]